ncbi:MAG: hypothetical protein WD357_09475 [Gracilimonas sp.]
MIKIPASILSLIFAFTVSAQAQFINLQLKVEPELSATVEQDLDFGTQVTNSGRTEVQLGDINMGIFSIRAFHTQNLYMSLQFPESLENNAPGIEAEIPLELSMNYNNSGTNSPANSTPLTENNGYISIHENTRPVNQNDIWKQMYIYVYGAIVVGNIPNGTYTADIVLSVDYD